MRMTKSASAASSVSPRSPCCTCSTSARRKPAACTNAKRSTATVRWPAGFLLADVEHVQHGLLGEKLEATDALFVIVIELQLAQRLVGFDRGLAPDQQVVFAIELGVLDLLAVLFEALQALFEHREIVEDELGLQVFHVAYGVDGALLMGNGVAGEKAQNVGEGVDIAQAGDTARVAQGLLGNGGHVHVFL